MLKYLYCKEVFSEIPSEISLGVSISGCTIRCPACHSRELWEDKGKPLTWDSLNALINIHHGITCVLLMGGEHDISTLTDLFYHARKYVKTAWYCGLDSIPKDKIGILQYLDYIKLGHYDPDLGGLSSPTTNQRLYQNYSNYRDYNNYGNYNNYDNYRDYSNYPTYPPLGESWQDITCKFWHQTSNKSQG